MDALTAITTARSWQGALALLRAARPDDAPSDVAVDLRNAATAVLCWCEVSLLLDASYSLRELQDAREDASAGRREALQRVQASGWGDDSPDAPDPVKRRPGASAGPDVFSQRARALADLVKTAAAVALAESRLRDEIGRLRDRLIRRVDFILGTTPEERDHEIAQRLAQVGDLNGFRALALQIERRARLADARPRELIVGAASELVEAESRARRAAALRDLAQSPAEVLAADAAEAQARAEVRAIQQRDQGGTSDDLAAAEAAAEALSSAGRLPS